MFKFSTLSEDDEIVEDHFINVFRVSKSEDDMTLSRIRVSMRVWRTNDLEMQEDHDEKQIPKYIYISATYVPKNNEFFFPRIYFNKSKERVM